MVEISKRKVRVFYSIIWGIVLTDVLTFVAFLGSSQTWGCTFAWNGCLGALILDSPMDLRGFVTGILFGVPFYSIVIFGILELWERRVNHYKKANLQ
jgi:hypothetical protein